MSTPRSSLQARMAAALALNASVLAGALALLVWVAVAVEDGWALLLFAFFFLAIGADASGRSAGAATGGQDRPTHSA